MDLLCDLSKPKAVLGIYSPHSLGPSPGNCLLFVTSWVFLPLSLLFCSLDKSVGSLSCWPLGLIFWFQFPDTIVQTHLLYVLAFSRPLLHFVFSRRSFLSFLHFTHLYRSELSPQGNSW